MSKHLVGDLKPNKIKERRVTETSVDITPAGIDKKKYMVAKVPIKNKV